MAAVLVLGGAESVFRDAERALDIGEFDSVITVNDVTASWKGDIEAAVSLHGEKWPLWLHRRQMAGLPKPDRVFAHQALKKSPVGGNPHITDFVDHLWPEQVDSGSSGLFAVKVALDVLLYDRVVLCGVPMEMTGHFFNPRPWGGAPNHRRGWMQARKRLEGRVTSMSGWTRTLLGEPTAEWMADDDRRQALAG